MFKIVRKEIEWGGRKLMLETGRIARQADGAVLATYGETVVLATVVGARTPKAGSISSPSPSTTRKNTSPPARFRAAISSAKAGPTERETLTSRLIDRPIRPLFAEGYRNETQVIVTVLSHDLENDPDIVGDGRRLRRADHFRHSLHGPDRGGARRLHRRRIQAQSRNRRDAELQARSRRRRHRQTPC